jgi:prepilin-type N-terminal cleavage/methylation domain-containing protein
MNRQSKSRLQPGFTIVELLIVIVVIGILAAITIVSYNGVTARANTASAQSAAQVVANKAELYNSDVSHYPYAGSDLSADPTKSYYLSSSSVAFTLSTTQPTSPNTVKLIKCGTTPNAAQSDITLGTGNLTGLRVYYWSYTASNATSYFTAGNDSGTGVACPAS